MNILVTGGTGFIGSHTVVELLNAGHKVTVIDNLSNSSEDSLKRVAEICGVDSVPFVRCDIRDRATLNQVFESDAFDAVIHFAGLNNLGTGTGYSVLDVVKAFEKANNLKVPYSIKPRRAGDIATCYSDPAKAYKILGWKAQYGIEDMCRHSWNFQQNLK